jgi:hypothetical protein
MRPIVGLVFSFLAAGCAVHNGPPPTTAASAPVASRPPVPVPAADRPERAHRMLIAATGCWFGGVWHDALSEADGVDRCAIVLEQAYGAVDRVRLERIRAVEAVEVEDLSGRLAVVARDEGADAATTAGFVDLLHAVAAAQHETLLARRAADRIKKDIASERDPERRPVDERASVAPLVESSALRALFERSDGAFQAEGQAIALMCAMDRMKSAIDLPKHIKVYAVGGPNELVFGVRPPAVPADATQPIKAGAWLEYLSAVAGAAGHPVPAKATTPPDQELMAWGGVLEGFADRLRVQAPAIESGTELRSVVEKAIERLDTEYRASEAAILTSHP